MGKTSYYGKTKVYRGKDGFTSTSTKIKVNQSSMWVRSGGTSKAPKKKK